ncbi:hypothetical protein CDV31_013524 [Fusarium ambrosium]|uniref:BD-FAE-like domain-containing protein n=1 Tax=Fusarium ambrosium TaxID=131363 RepID=A0A428T349_9HYPO|nr:hypothetical protein CDV31_013524 [Fusarium ambrosium]
MDQIADLGSLELYDQVTPTGQICATLITSQAAVINATKRETFSYGPHERHELDLYTPSPGTSNPSDTGNCPLLVFLYGGGFASGDKVFDLIPGDLVYPNLGSFFADVLGYETVVINYRLTKHGARFPRGADDLDLALKWLDKHYEAQGAKDVYIMGNSAGGVHLTTWLFQPEYAKSIKWLAEGTVTLKLKAAISLSCPFTWPQYVIDSKVGESVKGYYGDEHSVTENASLLLARRALASAPKDTVWPPILTIVAEMDPEDIRDSGKDFVKLWTAAGHRSEYRVLQGHNHFTTVWALRCGVPAFEKWAYDLGEWLKELK